MAAAYSPSKADSDLIDKVIKRFGEMQGSHASFVRNYERNERAYRGALSLASDAGKWKHKIHPPLALNLIETIIANTEEQGLQFEARPSPHVNMSLDEATEMLNQAEAVEDLIRHEHRLDNMVEKQRPLYMTAAIGGRGVGKCAWLYNEGPIHRQTVEMRDVYDSEENYLGSVPKVSRTVEHGVRRDHSTFEVVDPRDFMVHESARDLDPFQPGGAQCVIHKCRYSYEQLLMLQQAGYYKNIEYIEPKMNISMEYNDREVEVFSYDRSKDLIEVIEYWEMEDGLIKRTCIANRTVLIRDLEETPFDRIHAYPFVICSAMSQPFSTIGVSDIELVAQLQEMIWELMNQRLDNVELINNFVALIRDDVEDPDAYELFPGARWFVQDPNSVDILQPPYQLADLTLHAEAALMGNMQTVTSATPFAGGADSQTVDNKTATGASIVMNAAQTHLNAKKWRSQRSLVREANFRLANCQTFLDEPRLAHILGPDGAMSFREVDPLHIQADFLLDLNPESDSNMRQEKRAEASQFFQVCLAAAPLMAAAGKPFNLAELFRWFAKKWDVIEVDKFLSTDPGSMGPMAMGGPQGGGQGQPAPPGGNLGITAAPGPGAEMGTSPITDMARALTMGGGVANAPGAPGR